MVQRLLGSTPNQPQWSTTIWEDDDRQSSYIPDPDAESTRNEFKYLRNGNKVRRIFCSHSISHFTVENWCRRKLKMIFWTYELRKVIEPNIAHSTTKRKNRLLLQLRQPRAVKKMKQVNKQITILAGSWYEPAGVFRVVCMHLTEWIAGICCSVHDVRRWNRIHNKVDRNDFVKISIAFVAHSTHAHCEYFT